MSRVLGLLLLIAVVLTGCRWDASARPQASCSPAAGGRCAQDVPWHGSIDLTRNGHTLHGVIECGGTLHATETDTRVLIRLHVGAVGPGAMSCALVDVRVHLAEPLGSRVVYDTIGHHTVSVVRG
jgi:hypothetical protein